MAKPLEFEIEHVAISVEKPAQVAKWYGEHLGMRVVRALEKSPHTHFLADSAGHVMLEIYNNPTVAVPDYKKVHPLLLHIAFSAENVEGTRERLLAAGATAEGEMETLDNGDELAMMRDPWGLPIQIAKRARPML